jgi:hypothetical protein
MKNVFILLGFISFSGICFGQASVNTDKKPDNIIPSACTSEQVCCYYNTHSTAGWNLTCLTREECKKLGGTIFSSDKCVVITEDKPKKEERKKKNK